MNSAFLLVATAWLAAGDPGPVPMGPAIVSAPASCSGGSCGGGCGATCGHADACCDSCDTCCKPSCLQKLMSMFQHKKCCDTCDTCNTCSTCSAHTSACCDTCDTCCKPSCLDKLKALFQHKKCCDTCNTCGCDSGCANGSCGGGASYAPAYAPAIGGNIPSAPGYTPAPGGIIPSAPGGIVPTVPGVMPKAGEAIPAPAPAPKDTGAPLPKGDKTSQVVPGEGETKSPFELDRRYEARVARAPDYSYLTGQLFYVHADGGLWVLRYAPLWKEDQNGGSVILARDIRMESYREGDLVTVKGEILDSQRSSAFLGGPLYRAHSIQLIDRDSQ